MSGKEVELARLFGWRVATRRTESWLVDEQGNAYEGFLGLAFPRLMRELIKRGYSFTVDGHPEGFEGIVWGNGRKEETEEAETPESALFIAAHRLLCGDNK
jgi:hypothetical protein